MLRDIYNSLFLVLIYSFITIDMIIKVLISLIFTELLLTFIWTLYFLFGIDLVSQLSPLHALYIIHSRNSSVELLSSLLSPRFMCNCYEYSGTITNTCLNCKKNLLEDWSLWGIGIELFRKHGSFQSLFLKKA